MKKISFLMVGLLTCMFACSQSDSSPPGTNPSSNPTTNEQAPSTENETLSDKDASVPTNTPTPETDSGAQPQVDSGPKEPANQVECLAACEAKHPDGKVKADAISACWAAKCDPSCTHMPDRGPTNVRPATETKVCGVDYLPILTPSPSCSQCTHDECCAEWGACFSGLDSDCTKLNECANECWTKFAN